MTKENQTQPVSGAMTAADIEIISDALKASHQLFEGEMTDWRMKQVAKALRILSRAQDAQAVRNAVREQIARFVEIQRNDIPATGSEFAAAIRAMQLDAAQPVEKQDAVELPPLPAPLSTVEAWVTQDYGRKTSNEILEANDEYYTADQMREYALAAIAAIAANQLQQDELSVTRILLDVVPGEDGMGHEVYAKSAKEVEDLLNKQALRIEELTEKVRGNAQEPVAVVYPPDGTVSPFTVINLGLGAVQMGDCIHDNRLHALWFGKNGKGMGHEEQLNRAAHEGETLAVVTFSNVEGLDVLMEVLQRVRAKAFPAAAPQVAQESKGASDAST